MASALYPNFKENCLTQADAVDFDTDTIKVSAVDLTADYTYSAAHTGKASVTSYSGTTDQTLGSKTMTNGAFDAANSTFTAVTQDAAKTVGALVIWDDTTATTITDMLICYIDGFTPVTPNGGDITVTWDTTIFSL